MAVHLLFMDMGSNPLIYTSGHCELTSRDLASLADNEGASDLASFVLEHLVTLVFMLELHTGYLFLRGILNFQFFKVSK